MAVKSPTGGAVLAGAPWGRRQRPTGPKSRTGTTHGGRCSGFCHWRVTVPQAPQWLSAEQTRIQPESCEQDGVLGLREWQLCPHAECLTCERGTSPLGGGPSVSVSSHPVMLLGSALTSPLSDTCWGLPCTRLGCDLALSHLWSPAICIV